MLCQQQQNNQSNSWSTAQEEQTIDTQSAITNGGPNVKSRNAVEYKKNNVKLLGCTPENQPPHGQEAR